MSASMEIRSIFASTSQDSSSLDGVAYEMFAVGIFMFSLMFWHYISLRRRSVKRASADPRPPFGHSQASKLAVKAKLARADEEGQKRKVSRLRDKEQQMLSLLQNKEFTRALHIWRGLDRSGGHLYVRNAELLSSFVLSAVRVEKFDIVEQMLRVAKRNGVELALESWRALLKMLSTKKRYNVCLLIYSIFEGCTPDDQVVYSCFINAALDSNSPLEAVKMLPRYKASQVEPKDWMLFFRTYNAVGDVDAVEGIFCEIGCQTTPLMLNLLLLTCVNAKKPERAQKCLEKAHELEESGSSQIVNVVSYNTLIKGFAQNTQIERCFICLQGLFDHGLHADDATLGVLVELCIQEGFAERLLDFLKKTVALSTTVMCTHFLKLLIKTNKLEDAFLLYQEMKGNEQTPPDIVTCSVLISAFISERDFNHAEGIIEDMIVSGPSSRCYPDDLILARMLDGYRQAGLRDKGMALFERFVKVGVVPSDYTILVLVKLIGGNYDAAYDLVATCAQRFGTKPSVIHFTCLMSGAIRARNYDQAWKAYCLMRNNGVRADVTSVSTLVPGLLSAQRWDRVLEIVSSALTSDPPLGIPPEMLNTALGQIINARGGRQYALQLQLLMHSAGVPVTARNAQRL